MTKKEIEIKVDVMRQFELLRNTTFKDPLCFLDEDIQNADRSGAKNVYISYSGDALVIENDGSVLHDPEVLFTMGKSGWDEEVKENENPFGMGFFSNIPTSNYIEIFSGHFHVVFDERNGLEIYSEEIEEYTDGFKLVLHDFKLKDIYSWHIENRVALLGKYIHQLNIFYNNQQIEKKPLTKGDGLPFELQITEEPNFIGWLSFTNSHFRDDRINIFYKGRYVTTLDTFYYVKGDIHVSDQVLTLQSPDRKDIIQDEKFGIFKNQLRAYIEKMAEIAMLTGSEEEIIEYENPLDYYANKDSLRYRMPFSVFDGKNEKDMNYLDGIALAISKNEKVKTLGAAEVFLKKEVNEKEEREKELAMVLEFEEEKAMKISTQKEEEEEYEEEEEEKQKQKQKQERTSELPIKRTSVRKQRTSIPSPAASSNRNKLYLSKDNHEVVFWLKFEEVNQYKKRIQLIQQYGIRMIIAQNKIEENILACSSLSRIYHLSHLEEKVTIKSYLSNKILSAKEKRAMMLLDMISRMYDYEKNVFEIGDLMVTKLVEVPQLNLEFEKIEENITVVANKEEQTIYIDRSIIENSMLSEHLHEEIEMSDYKFILLHLKQLIEEFALLKANGNKQELYEKTIMALAIA